MFDDETVLLREICNGIMCMGAIWMIAIFVPYIYRRVRTEPGWYSDIVVQAAIAIIVLVLGHLVARFAGWMQFLWVDMGWDADYWANASDIFLTATVLTVLGKMMNVYAFSVWRWRWVMTGLALSTSIGIPLAVAAIFGRLIHD